MLVQLVDKNLLKGIRDFKIVGFLLILLFYRYNMTSHYKTHMGIHRKYSKTYTCKECSAVFRYKKKLCEHMFESHKVLEKDTHVSVITESSMKVENIL